MDTSKLIQLMTKKSANMVYAHCNYGTPCLDDCRELIRGIFELATEEERREIMYSLVKYDYRKEFENMIQ